MAIYRIYPDKDTFIFSEPDIVGRYGNAGRDEILELGSYVDSFLRSQKSRILVQFSNEDLQKATTYVQGENYTTNLHLSLAVATNLHEYRILTYPVSSSWVVGMGKRDDVPMNFSGVSWEYRGALTGSWNNLGGDYIIDYESIQENSVKSSHDVDVDVTSIVSGWISGSLGNNGFLLKLDDSVEDLSEYPIYLKYFGSDTNTIFPPYLEFRWDDSIYTGSLPVLSTDVATILIKNHKENYYDEDCIRFDIFARPKYPPRTFTTSSVYMNNYRLPSGSTWAIKDEYTGRMIINFNDNYTKISADDSGSYFTVYMDTFQPERYYRVLIKTFLGGSTVVVDNRNIFKIVRSGD